MGTVPASSMTRLIGSTLCFPPSQLAQSSVHAPKGQQPGLLQRLRQWFQKLDGIETAPGKSWWNLDSASPNMPTNKLPPPAKLRAIFLRLFMFIKEDKLLLSIGFFLVFTAAITDLALPHFLTKSVFTAAAAYQDPSLVAVFKSSALTLGVLSIFHAIATGLRGTVLGTANVLLVIRLRERLFSQIMYQDIAFFDETDTGSLMSRLSNDCQAMSRCLGMNINIILRNSLQFIGGMLYLLRLSWKLAFATAGITAGLWAVDTRAGTSQVLEEAMSMVRVVRAFGGEKREELRHHEWNRRGTGVHLRIVAAYGLFAIMNSLLYHGEAIDAVGHDTRHCGQLVAVFIGGAMAMRGQLTAQQLTSFILYIELAVSASLAIGEQWAGVMEAIGASERVLELLDKPPAAQLIPGGGRKLEKLTGHIEFRNVSFHYPTRPQAQILKGVDLVMKPGQVTALVGLSGSGKSTLVSLLQRFYEPTEGTVLIDGWPLTELDVKWFRSQLGVVSQEPSLFVADIETNIAYGIQEGGFNQLEVEHAAMLANAHQFITQLPEGYKTPVSNTSLSGGQKQRLAIARALVRHPKILILDEATSALDAESERLVQEALDRVMRGRDGSERRSVVVIAHRLSTIRDADQIVMMKNGTVAEVGTHDELLRRNGEYAQLTRRQLAGATVVA
eukprot:jgi/Chlat1/9090/Chrsp97S08376